MRSICFFCVFLAACSGTSRPKEILPQEQMQAVLYDVIRADEMVELRKLSDSTWRPFSRRADVYDTVFQLHGTSKEAFQKSLTYYQGRPDLLKEIIEGMEQTAKDTSAAAQKRLRLEKYKALKKKN